MNNITLQSIGYKNTILILDELFEKKYKIEKIMFSDDKTTFDFRMVINFPKLKGVDISIAQSGESHMYSLGGTGFIGIMLPVKDGIFILPSGEMGDGLDVVIGDDSLRWGADAGDLNSVRVYIQKFKKYYEENYC